MGIINAEKVWPQQTRQSDYLAQCVEEAARIITPYWPISSFIASNGLGGLEHLPFSQAIKFAQDLRGTQGYLSLATYRQFFSKGRITTSDLEVSIAAALNNQGLPLTLPLGNKEIRVTQLYLTWLLAGENPSETQKKNDKLWQAVSWKLQTLRLPDAPDEKGATGIAARVETLGERCFTNDGQTVTSMVNRRMIKWCAAFLDEGQAAWAIPGREQGFYACWKRLAGLDPSIPGYLRPDFLKKLQTLPGEASQDLELLLEEQEIPKADWSLYLTRHLAQLPGWASLIRWREEHPETLTQKRYPITLIEYLAPRLFYETALIGSGQGASLADKLPGRKNSASFLPKDKATTSPANLATITRLVELAASLNLSSGEIEKLPGETIHHLVQLASNLKPQNQQILWHEAFERHYRHQLLGELRQAQTQKEKQTNSSPKEPGIAPSVQAVFCIDVRSEGLRRHLEKRGAYETYGFAGFFGVPMLYQPLGSSSTLSVAPALITPIKLIKEQPKDASQDAIERRSRFNRWRYGGHKLIYTLRENLLTPFAFVEMAGWLSFFPLVGKTLIPGRWRRVQRGFEEKLAPSFSTEPSIVTDPAEMSLMEQAAAAANLLRSIGLIGQFARLIFLCGHGSETENNPYASALDCGACGGNHGGPSAVVAAGILNRKPVRKLLEEQGIVIPEETFFLAGEHNTTTDSICFLNERQLPASHLAEFERFKENTGLAGEDNARERWQKLPGTAKIKAKAAIKLKLQQRAADWAQVRPEWGLVRNAAFICGSRALTNSLNLNNRVFLHSYNPRQDPEGNILEGILTAPVVVAEWINMQYYLSSIDNQNFGSGTKLLHTVVSQAGVMQGRQSDLLIGLPQQAVKVGEKLFHEPMRLCVIVEAPTTTISNIIAKHQKLQHLTNNEWIRLVAFDTLKNTFYQYIAGGEWVEVDL